MVYNNNNNNMATISKLVDSLQFGVTNHPWNWRTIVHSTTFRLQ